MSVIHSVPIQQSFFSDKPDLPNFLEQFKNVFDCGGFVAGGLPLMYYYSNMDLWEILTTNRRIEITPENNKVFEEHRGLYSSLIGLAGDLDVWFSSKEESDLFHKKFIKQGKYNKHLIAFSDNLTVEYWKNVPNTNYGKKTFAETYKMVDTRSYLTRKLEKTPLIRKLVKSFIKPSPKPHTVQLVSSFMDTPENIVSNFDFFNSMVGFNDKRVFYHEDFSSCVSNKVLKINKMQHLNLYRLTKYIAKYDIRSIENQENLVESIYNNLHAEEDKSTVRERLTTLLTTESILLSLLNNDTVSMLASILSCTQLFKLREKVDGVFKAPYYYSYVP